MNGDTTPMNERNVKLCLAYVLLSTFIMLLTTFAFGEDFRVVDGDTFKLAGETFRIRGMDTPEIRSKDAREKHFAILAKDELARLLSEKYEIKRTGRDKYGRTVAEIYINGKDVAEIMVTEGLARPYVYRLTKDRTKILEGLGEAARAQGKGLWGH